MELLQLKYFCDAAQTENFSKTAKKFLVPTSNISQSVKRFGRELGVELFEHRANKIALADAGKRFYEKAKLALEMLEDAKNEVMGGGTSLAVRSVFSFSVTDVSSPRLSKNLSRITRTSASFYATSLRLI